MKNIKQWLTDRIPAHKQPLPGPIAERVRLDHHCVALSDEQFLSVKIATEEHIDDLLSIERRCYDGHTPWNRAALFHEIRYNKNAFYMVVTDQKEPVAFLGSWFVSREAHITNIATIPEYEGRGIATFLIEELKQIAIFEKMDKISLEVRVSNTRAQRLYKKMQFTNGRVKKGYYANDREDALEMTMMLTNN
ncbi:ribosomal protein S18-alanine N-acetyltransferase [Marinilactibacillus sp. XAAS-LB27]|uniref:ribosomal protein S18-alanine N-acetyltransferase n=1 Tax=Marinilactibacillus sp. XAAS-LB27 TaxID=3114538 RepID=UPI002E185780|nr:ribosomal protein S18-alanine N-acetyltransferase [Marinilactibacillus sp. XAAS-LB27]